MTRGCCLGFPWNLHAAAAACLAPFARACSPTMLLVSVMKGSDVLPCIEASYILDSASSWVTAFVILPENFKYAVNGGICSH
eukprot:5180057-Amphidinium_carterae.1